MAASGPASAAAPTAPPTAACPCPRLRTFSAPGLRPHASVATLTTTSTSSTAFASAAPPWAIYGMRTARPLKPSRAPHAVPHEVVIGTSHFGRAPPALPQPGFPSRCARGRGPPVRARYFREGSSPEGHFGGEPPPPPPPPPPKVSNAAPNADAASSGGEGSNAAGRGGDAGGGFKAPQGNAVPFVPSTRQRHQAAAAAAAATAAARDWRSAGNGSDEDEAYAGPDEDIRRRAHAMREAMFSEARQRAVGLHPNILVDELAAEASVPYDAAGSLDPPPVRDEEGEAAGPPSGGSGPYGGLVVESIDPDTGGFTASWPAVDPAYDDVGRAIREETEPGVRRRRRSSSSLMAAEAQARKAATAEDLRDALLDAEPQLQSTYKVYGLPRDDLLRPSHGGTVAAGDEEVEALLEALPFGVEGGVLAEEGAESPEAASALADPLTSPSSGVSPGDPVAALDALEHRKVLELLESGATASTDSALADLSDVMPSPLLAGTSPPPHGSGAGAGAAAASSIGRNSNGNSGSNRRDASAASSNSGGSSSRSSSSTRRRVMRLGRGATCGPPRALSRGHVGRRVRTAAMATADAEARRTPPPSSSSYPPFYHTSPDVPDEDLQHRPRRRGKQRSTVPTATAAAAAARVVLGTGREGQSPAAGDVTGTGAASDQLSWSQQTALYTTSPDVPDAEVEGAGEVAESQPTPGLARAGNERAPVDGGEPPGSVVPSPSGGGPSDEGEAKSSTRAGTAAMPMAAAVWPPAPSPPPPLRADGDNRRLRSLSDVDRQFIEFDTVSGWDEQAHDLRSAMRSTVPKPGRATQPQKTTQPPGARGASSSLQAQTIGIHGSGGGGGAAAAAAAAAPLGGGGGSGISGGGDVGRSVTVLRVECVPSQTYGVARTAAVLAADGQLTLLARPPSPSPERVRAALKLLHMAPGTRDFRESAAAAAAAAADNDEREAVATEAAAVAAAMAAVGTPGMELEAQHRQPSPAISVDERDLQPGLLLGQSEIDPADVEADPNFPMDSSWADHHDHHDHHDPHDPHVALGPMAEGEGHILGLQGNAWREDYDEVMGQIVNAQRSGWSEDAVNGAVFDSDVY